MPRVKSSKKVVTEYTVKMTSLEMKCIVEVIGSTSTNERENMGCTVKEAKTGDEIYEVFVEQLRKDGYKVNGI